jgi:hypothetical protein
MGLFLSRFCHVSLDKCPFYGATGDRESSSLTILGMTSVRDGEKKVETCLPAATVLGSFHFVRLPPHFGQDDRAEGDTALATADSSSLALLGMNNR